MINYGTVNGMRHSTNLFKVAVDSETRFPPRPHERVLLSVYDDLGVSKMKIRSKVSDIVAVAKRCVEMLPRPPDKSEKHSTAMTSASYSSLRIPSSAGFQQEHVSFPLS